MMGIQEDLSSFMERLKSAPFPRSSFCAIPTAQCTPDGVVGRQIRQNVDYFTIQVTDTSSAKGTIWETYDPMVIVFVAYMFGKERVLVPFVADQRNIKDFKSRHNVEFNYNVVAGPHPFRGESISIDAIFYKVKKSDTARSLIGIAQAISSAVGSPADMRILRKIGSILIHCLEILIKTTEIEPMFGGHIEIDTAGLDGFISGYYVFADGDCVDTTRLHVHGGALTVEPRTLPLTNLPSNYLLFKVSSRAAQTDEAKSSFFALRNLAMDAVAIGGEDGWARAKAILVTLYEQMALSNDLTPRETEYLFENFTEEILAARERRQSIRALSPGKNRTALTVDVKLNEAARLVNSLGPTPELDKCEYVVWYGTNRLPNDLTDFQKGYSAERDSRIHHGFCRVYVPKSHKIGSLGSPWWKRLITLTDDRLKLISLNQLHSDAFWEKLASKLRSAVDGERHAVVFIHGYNVSFEDAALRAAQIGFDLSIRGAMAFFSWPSKGRVDGYAADAATIEVSEAAIADFLVGFAKKSGADTVHIIAHSMGNRGVLRAVNRIAAGAQRRSGIPFDQIILAAADVDADLFGQLSAAYGRVCRRTTLYVSERDHAVEASRWLHGYSRAGLVPPICIVPGIDTVNVTNTDITLFGHGYVASARSVLQDMHQLIVRGTAPQWRFGLRAEKTDVGASYWVIAK